MVIYNFEYEEERVCVFVLRVFRVGGGVGYFLFFERVIDIVIVVDVVVRRGEEVKIF